MKNDMQTDAKKATSKSSSHLNGAANDIGSDLKIKFDNATEAFEDVPQYLSEKAEELTSSLLQNAEGYVQAGRKYMKENPGRALLISTAVGAVIGGLLSYVLTPRENSKSH